MSSAGRQGSIGRGDGLLEADGADVEEAIGGSVEEIILLAKRHIFDETATFLPVSHISLHVDTKVCKRRLIFYLEWKYVANHACKAVSKENKF